MPRVEYDMGVNQGVIEKGDATWVLSMQRGSARFPPCIQLTLRRCTCDGELLYLVNALELQRSDDSSSSDNILPATPLKRKVPFLRAR